MTLQIIVSVMGGFLNTFLGEFDRLLITLITFVILDYITGIMQAIVTHKLNSKVGFKGIFKKVLIFFIVNVATMLDSSFGFSCLRYITITFYIVNEAISIVENAAILGLPIPDKIKKVLNEIGKK